jgi:hypothetical protein
MSRYLLVEDRDLEAVHRKAQKYGWARAALDRLLADAERARRRPLQVPDRGGQWPHWYSCKIDGAPLRTVSPTEHRCSACGTVYRGDPYDSVVVGRTHSENSRALRDLGLAYRLTGRQEFARRAGEILTGYAGKYLKYPRHDINGEDNVRGGRIGAQTLDESTWLIPVAWGYSLVRDSLPEEGRQRIETGLLAPAAEEIREHRMGIHNIQCWKNSAVGLAALASGNESQAREAIEDPERGFRVQIAKGVTEDGLWWEGSLGYHRYTMEALWPLAEGARLAGIDLYTDRYRRLYDAPIALALPNGDPPGFNDSAGGNLTTYASLYEIAFARWARPEYGRVAAGAARDNLQALLWGAESVPSGDPVPTAGSLLRSAGYAVLREPGVAVAVRFGMHGGGHGHPDKLNIVTFSGGRVFGLDPGSINYGVPLHREWYRSTIAHNTVSVDEAVQASADGKLEDWGGTSVSAAAEAYPGVTLRRSLALGEGRLVDRFECSSESEHTYDWAFHAPGRIETSLALEPRTTPLGRANGYQHIEQVREGRADGEWWVRWEAGGARWTIRMQGAPGTQVFTGVAPGRDPTERVPLVVARRRAARTVFAATHQAGRG